jgi:hypothetical protein
MKFESIKIKSDRLIKNINNHITFYDVKTTRKMKLKSIINNTNKELYDRNRVYDLCNNINVFIVDSPLIKFLSVISITINTVHTSLENVLSLIKKDRYNMFFVYYFDEIIVKYNTYNIRQLKEDLKYLYLPDYRFMHNVISLFINDYEKYLKNNLIMNEV